MKRPSTGRSQLRQAYSLTPFRDSAAHGDSRELQDRLRYVAIADTEQAYAMRLMTFLDSSGRIPFDTRVFTEPAGAVRAMQEEEILILVASQSFYSLMLSREMGGTYSLPGEERMPGAERPAPPPVMILAEEGGACGEGVTVVSKYQAMEGIELEILKLLMTLEYIPPSPVRQGAGMELIGVYTPLSRCLQTTFSLCLGMMLAKKDRVLYMNFEAFSGLEYMLDRTFRGSVSDLLYFNSCAREKISGQMRMMTEQVGGLDILPPMRSFIELRAIPPGEWLDLMRVMEQVSEYRYVILDLSEHVDHVFDILRACSLIYTLTRDDPFSEAKMRQYEALLSETEYQDVISRTRKLQLPVFRELPANLKWLTRGELADVVRELIGNGDYDDL